MNLRFPAYTYRFKRVLRCGTTCGKVSAETGNCRPIVCRDNRRVRLRTGDRIDRTDNLQVSAELHVVDSGYKIKPGSEIDSGSNSDYPSRSRPRIKVDSPTE